MSLVSRYLAVPRILYRSERGTSLNGSEDFDNPALPSVLTGLIHARSSQISQVPDSTLETHAPLSAPGWPGNITASECFRVLPSASLEGVGFPRLYTVSGVYHAACVLATTVLHGEPHGVPRRVRYRPAGGRWPGGTCTHWLRMTHFMGTTLCAPFPKVSVIVSHPGTPNPLLEILDYNGSLHADTVGLLWGCGWRFMR